MYEVGMMLDWPTLVLYLPYTGPPTPGSVKEWHAFCPMPLPTGRYGEPPQQFGAWGATREEAIEGLKAQLQKWAKTYNVEQTTISIWIEANRPSSGG